MINQRENMTVNCVNIGREEESLNIANINLLVRFNKTRQIFPSVTRVLTILQTTTATSADSEKVNSKEGVFVTASGNILAGGNFCFRVFKLQLKVINKNVCYLYSV